MGTNNDASDHMAVLEQATLALQSKGEKAELHHTGGGIYCVYVPVKDNKWTWWGTSDDVWGCDIYEGDDYAESHGVDVPASLDTIPQAVESITSYVNSLREGRIAR